MTVRQVLDLLEGSIKAHQAEVRRLQKAKLKLVAAAQRRAAGAPLSVVPDEEETSCPAPKQTRMAA